jgi:hypothetical protein
LRSTSDAGEKVNPRVDSTGDEDVPGEPLLFARRATHGDGCDNPDPNATLTVGPTGTARSTGDAGALPLGSAPTSTRRSVTTPLVLLWLVYTKQEEAGDGELAPPIATRRACAGEMGARRAADAFSVDCERGSVVGDDADAEADPDADGDALMNEGGPVPNKLARSA